MTSLLTDFYAWGSALAWAIFAAAAIVHIRHASQLSSLINARWPQLWQTKWDRMALAQSWRRNALIYPRGNAGRLDRIVIFNTAADAYPDDPQFLALLKTCRWSALLCLLSFLTAIVLLGLATPR